MQFTVELPDDLASQMTPAGYDPARAALEDMAVEAYRAGRLSEHQLAQALGLGRYDLDGFLKRRNLFFETSLDELNKEVEDGELLWQRRKRELAALTE